jgi:glycosyltransferase involved in cell wall biosynthesis
MMPRTYSVVTPARDEAANLRRLARCILEQTVLPDAWVIADDGSVDGTRGVAERLAEQYPWIRVLSSPGALTHDGPLDRGRSVGRDVVAFKAGLAELRAPTDVVLKLDADVSVDADFFERLLGAFAEDPSLGITSGTCYELEDGEWRPQFVTAGHARGATRAYRWICLQEVSPLEERLGWDGVDELKARSLGWKTTSLPNLPFRHHRALGKRDGATRSWAGMGRACYFIGYRPLYLAARTIFKARHDPAALAMLLGYMGAWVRRDPRCEDPGVRATLRELHSIRRLGRRFREATGQTLS